MASADAPPRGRPPDSTSDGSAHSGRSATSDADDHPGGGYDRQGSGGAARGPRQGCPQEAPRQAGDDDHQHHAGYRHRDHDRARVWRRCQHPHVRGRNAADRVRVRPGPPRGNGLAGPGCDRDGSRRPRKDDASGCHPGHPSGGGGSRRDHPTHRRVYRADQEPARRVPRHTWTRGVYADAGARRARHRHRYLGRRGRRRRDAPDPGGDRSRAGGPGPHHRGDQQDRQAGCQHGACKARTGRPRADARGVGWPDRDRRDVRQEETEYRAAARDDLAGQRPGRVEGRSQTQRGRNRPRGQARPRPRAGRHCPCAGWHVEHRRQLHRWYRRGESTGPDRRGRTPREEGGPVDPSRGPGTRGRSTTWRCVSGPARSRQGSSGRRLPASAGQAKSPGWDEGPPDARNAAAANR